MSKLADELDVARCDAEWLAFLLGPARNNPRYQPFLDRHGNPCDEVAGEALRQLGRAHRMLRAAAGGWGPPAKSRGRQRRVA